MRESPCFIEKDPSLLELAKRRKENGTEHSAIMHFLLAFGFLIMKVMKLVIACVMDLLVLFVLHSSLAMSDLSIKKCVPCDTKDLKHLTEDKANLLISQVPEWELVNESGVLKLHRSWKVKSFTKGLEFFQVVADVAEAEGHHPDLHLVGWNNVKIDIWTHSAGGLTENDFILAAKINGLDLHHLLRKKTAK